MFSLKFPIAKNDNGNAATVHAMHNITENVNVAC